MYVFLKTMVHFHFTSSYKSQPLPLSSININNTHFENYKWNESGFRPPLCTYRLNWARRTSWGWWDDWDDTVLQTQDSKFEPWRSEAEHATSRSRRLPTILTFTRGWGRNNFVSFKPPRPGTEPRTLAWKAAVLTTTLGPPPLSITKRNHVRTQSTNKRKVTINQNEDDLIFNFTPIIYHHFGVGIATEICTWSGRKDETKYRCSTRIKIWY